jgi:hypothetical protein
MILVPNKERKLNLGFGFSILLAGQTPRCVSEMDLIIGSHRDEEFVIGSGKGREFGEEQLKYSIATEQGMSGSPIFLAYNGVETVIGIQ